MKCLADLLTQTECHLTPLEVAIRGERIALNSFFLKDSQLAIPVFSPVDSDYDIADKIASFLPHLASQNRLNRLAVQNTVLGPCSAQRIAILFSGGPAPGGHNVVAGLLQLLSPNHTVLGILGGPGGFSAGEVKELTLADGEAYFNSGGFNWLGTDRTKLTTPAQIAQVKSFVRDHRLSGLVVIGGDDSNTNAAVLANELIDLDCTVVGVPKTIDGDVCYRDQLPISFGFDTATKLYSELVGNLMQDAQSVKKYWHFVKLMGRDTSHVTLEVALQTKPTITLITEEIIDRKQSLSDIIDYIVSIIKARYDRNLSYGVIVIPEGLIEHISDDIVHFLTDYNDTDFMNSYDDHGHRALSAVPTEALLGRCVQYALKESDVVFQPRYHSFGYEGRCGVPTRFDAWYAYHLGLTAGALVLGGHTGYMAAFNALPVGGEPLGIPLIGLFESFRSDACDRFAIKRAPVDLASPAFTYFQSRRQAWSDSDCFTSPGPIQLYGPLASQFPITVALNQGYESLDIFGALVQ